MNKLKVFLLSSLGGGAIFVATLIGLTHYKMAQHNVLTAATFITIEKGTSFNQFSKQLNALGVIDNRFWLRNYVRIYRDLAHIKAGTYQILPSQTLKQMLEMISQGKEHQFTITFVEGSTLQQWLALMAANEHIKHTLSEQAESYQHVAALLKLERSHPEGLFYPETYAFTRGTSDVEILTRAYQKMQTELNQAWQNRAAGLPYENPYQALIMASIIEKESGKQAEHEVIASVFINRLALGMRLQTDPTVIYGLGEQYQGDIKRKHLKQLTPYNTYKIKGLPPTPIAMAGKSAIAAALNPAPSDYLYFVSNGEGKHIFSTNLADHNAAVVKYQLSAK